MKFKQYAIRFAIIFGLMCFTVWIAYLYLDPPVLGIDDAYIFFVYGQNVAAGQGAVYNIGSERVEGYSSILWMLIVAMSFLVSNNPELFLLSISLVLVTGAIAYLWLFIEYTTQERALSFLLLVWIFSSPSFVVWVSLPLMDTALWCSLLVLGTVLALQGTSSRLMALLVGLILLARPEGMIWAVLLIGCFGLTTASQTDSAIDWRSMRLPLVVYVLVLGGILIFRMSYFGYPLPNTYYAKVSPEISLNLTYGMLYFALFAYTNMVILVGLVPAIAGIFFNLRWIISSIKVGFQEADIVRSRYVAISLIVVVGLIVPVWGGGDHFHLFRFYQPIWPLIILPVISLMTLSQPPLSKMGQYGLFGVAAVIFFTTPLVNWHNYFYTDNLGHEFKIAHMGRDTGRVLNRLFQDELPSIGVLAAGGIAYEYNGPVIDLLGLNNVVMAHAPGDRQGFKGHASFNSEVFFSQRPDLLLPMIGPEETLARDYKSYYEWSNEYMKGLLTDDQFLARYELIILSKDNHQVLVYVHRNYLERLVGDGYKISVLSAN